MSKKGIELLQYGKQIEEENSDLSKLVIDLAGSYLFNDTQFVDRDLEKRVRNSGIWIEAGFEYALQARILVANSLNIPGDIAGLIDEAFFDLQHRIVDRIVARLNQEAMKNNIVAQYLRYIFRIEKSINVEDFSKHQKDLNSEVIAEFTRPEWRTCLQECSSSSSTPEKSTKMIVQTIRGVMRERL